MKQDLYRRGLMLLLSAAVLLSCAGCSRDLSAVTTYLQNKGKSVSVTTYLQNKGISISATTMHLQKTTGTVDISNKKGKNIKPIKNLKLYSGYEVGTQSESYAWINLDRVKLTKLDQNSVIDIQKEDKHLVIEVKSGSLFFNVTEPLKDDETLNIRTSTMVVGIRGTCGWVEVSDPNHMKVYLLEGTVELTAGGNSAAITAGEMAEMTADGDITISSFSLLDVPGFVADELGTDETLNLTVPDASDPDIAIDPMESYNNFLNTLERVAYSEIIDFEADGSPELLVISAEEQICGFIVQIYRSEPDGSLQHLIASSSMEALTTRQVTCSLVEFNGRLFVHCRTETPFGSNIQINNGRTYYDLYYGSLAERNGGQGDWGQVDSFECNEQVDGGNVSRSFLVRPHNEKGFVDKERLNDVEQIYSPQEQEAFLNKYTFVRELCSRSSDFQL